jgi:HEAT repeats
MRRKPHPPRLGAPRALVRAREWRPGDACPKLACVTTGISALISRLNDPSTDIAEDAKDALIAQGAVVIPELAVALPGLDRFGKLSAIQVFEACGDRRAGPGLVGLLSDADTTVREWAANALGALGYTEAGPALARLNARLQRELVRPDFTEPVAIRSVLTLFGLRRHVTPGLTRTLARDTGHGQTWPVARLPEVLRDLADHDQVVLYFMIWQAADHGQLHWTQHEQVGWAFDRSLPWSENVADARDAALLEADFVHDTGDLVATIEWIDEGDVAVPPPAAGPLSPRI